jgi:hypothetical protein
LAVTEGVAIRELHLHPNSYQGRSFE